MLGMIPGITFLRHLKAFLLVFSDKEIRMALCAEVRAHSGMHAVLRGAAPRRCVVRTDGAQASW